LGPNNDVRDIKGGEKNWGGVLKGRMRAKLGGKLKVKSVTKEGEFGGAI